MTKRNVIDVAVIALLAAFIIVTSAHAQPDMFVKPAPFPLSWFAGLLITTIFVYVPRKAAAGRTPVRLPAVIAYGVGVSF